MPPRKTTSKPSKRSARRPKSPPATPPPVGRDIPAEAPPSVSGGAGRELWRELVALIPAGQLLRADMSILTLTCQWWSIYSAAMADVSARGNMLVLPNGNYQLNPQLKAASLAADKLRHQLADLGLTPAARARLKISFDGPPGDDSDL